MTRSSKKTNKRGGKKTNKRYSKKKGGINWKFWEKKPVDTAVAAPTEPTAPASSAPASSAPAPAPTCPPCPVCQQQPVTPAAAEAIKEERAMMTEPASAPPALESQLGGKRKRKTRRNRTKKSKKSKKLWFQIGCVKI